MKRAPQADLSPQTCPVCGEGFQPYRATQRACSRKCREALGPLPDEQRPYTLAFTCRICGREREARTTVKGGRRYHCDDCAPEAARRRAERKNANRSVARSADPERRRAVNRRTLLARRYGITPEQYDEMFAAQNGVCALCGEPADPNGVKAASRLHVDHDHETGKVRELLCNHCNRGIGAFRDDPELMQRASLYVFRHRMT